MYGRRAPMEGVGENVVWLDGEGHQMGRDAYLSADACARQRERQQRHTQQQHRAAPASGVTPHFHFFFFLVPTHGSFRLLFYAAKKKTPCAVIHLHAPRCDFDFNKRVTEIHAVCVPLSPPHARRTMELSHSSLSLDATPLLAVHTQVSKCPPI